VTDRIGRTVDGPSINLRPATPDDAELLLAWANEPATRAASLRSDPIDRPTHLAWLAARLASPSCRIWIGTTDDEAVGVVRFEVGDDGRATVSIAVAPEARGRGLGRRLLAAGIEAARIELRPRGFRARIRADNEASIAVFRGAGFQANGRPANGRASDAVVAVLEYVLDDGGFRGSS
jgi:UDP-2,4-diacetamido-2,4,6-trideoxy-beta-L-altropyranose hydrolase